MKHARGRRRARRLGRMLLALAMALLLSGAELTPVLAVTQADIDALKNESSDLSAEKKELQAKLDELAEDKSTAMERKTLLDQQIATTSAQISNVEEQIQQYGYTVDAVKQTILRGFVERGLRCTSDDEPMTFTDSGHKEDFSNIWAILMALLRTDWFPKFAASCTWYDDGTQEDVLSQAEKVSG